MNSTYFTGKMKMADLILKNFRLLYILPSFELGIGIGEESVKQVCEKKGISLNLFLLVCNLYTFNDYKPDNNTLKAIPLDALTRFLKNSHKDYLETRMPSIITHIMELVTSCHINHANIFEQFCKKYRDEVVAHFKYEEEIVFPYIIRLLEGKKSDNYDIKQYIVNHTDIDSALHDLKNIIIKYMPGDCSYYNSAREILIDLSMFEDDLEKHTLLEDKILISLAEKIESRI